MNDNREDLLQKKSPYILKLEGTDTTFRLDEVIGLGGSSIVYRGYYNKGNQEYPLIIKELYPIDVASYYRRASDGTIHIKTELPDSTRNKAEAEFAFYKMRAERENDIIDKLCLCDDGKAIDPRLFESKLYAKGNNTVYTMLAPRPGKTLQELLNMRDTGKSNYLSSFPEMCECVLEILMALSAVHNKNYLHLDVSPDNIHILNKRSGPDKRRPATLIDFNSAFNPGEEDSNEFVFSIKEGFSAPELSSSYGIISKTLTQATDLYSIASIFFYMLKKREPDITRDITNKTRWLLTNESEYCEDLHSSVINECNRIIAKGIDIDDTKRYQCIDDMYKDIKHLIEIFHSPISLRKTKFKKVEGFVGRKTELIQINEKLKENNTLFISGVGGIGKSSLVQQYLSKQRKYKTVVYVRYSNNLARDIYYAFEGFDNHIQQYRQELKTDEAIFLNIFFPKLQELCDDNVLLFIDNFDTDNDPYIKIIVCELNCKKIITSRYNYEERISGHTINLVADTDLSSLKQLFYNNYLFTKSKMNKEKYDSPMDSYVDKIIKALDGHTLAIKLLANQARKIDANLPEIIERFQKSGYEGGYETPFFDGLSPVEKTAYRHIRSIFNFSGIKGVEYSVEIELLKVLTFVPLCGIKKNVLLEWCGFSRENGKHELNKLVDWNWVQQDEMNNISMHPLIGEVIWRELKPSIEEVFLAKYKDNLLNNSIGADKTSDESKWYLEAIIAFALKLWENTELASNVLVEIYYRILILMNYSTTDSLLTAMKAITPVVIKKYSKYTYSEIYDMLSTEVLDVGDDEIFSKMIFLEAVVLLAYSKSSYIKNDFVIAKTRLKNCLISIDDLMLNEYFNWFDHFYVTPTFADSKQTETKWNEIPTKWNKKTTSDTDSTINVLTLTKDGITTQVNLLSYFSLVNSKRKFVIYESPDEKHLPNNLVKLSVAEVVNKDGENVLVSIDAETYEDIKVIMKDMIQKGSDSDN